MDEEKVITELDEKKIQREEKVKSEAKKLAAIYKDKPIKMTEFEKFSDKYSLQPDETSLVFEILKQEGVEIQEESEEVVKDIVFDNIEVATDDSVKMYLKDIGQVPLLRPEEELELAKSASFIITLNYFIQFMRQAILLFRDATGTFYNDRWKPLFEGVINIGLSIGFIFLFSYCFGEDFAVVGVIVATIITNLTICHIVEPHVLYKYGLRSKTRDYYIRNYAYIAAFTALLVALHFCLQALPTYDSEWMELLVHGSIAVAFAVVPCVAVVLLNKDFRHYFKQVFERLKNKFKRTKTAE